MFAGNPNLRGDGESLQMEAWQLAELRKCVRDPVYFANNYVKITTKDKGIQLFNTWDFQSDLIQTMKDNRFVVAKFPRQCGKSTTTRAFLLWQALFTRDITIAILANKLALAMEQLQQLKESYAMLPYWMQPGLVEWNKKRIQLCHNTKVMCAATSPDGIRGLSVNILYIDEFAFIPNYIADEFIASIFPTISSGQTTKIFITSCVPKNTMVFTDKGIHEIGEFVKHEDSISGYGYEIDEYNVVGFRDKMNHGTIMHNEGIRDTRIISTQYTEVECTNTHKWWSCINGKYDWVKSSDLSVGDYVSVKYGMNCWGNDDIDFIDPSPDHKKTNRLGDIKTLTPDLAYLIGLYISEGYISDMSGNRALTITCGDDLTQALKSLNLRYYIESDGLHYKITSSSLVSLFKHLGFDVNRKAPQKIIPTRLMRLSKECTSAMIQGIFDGDGCAHKSKQKVAIGLSSKRLIEQLRVLFINYGILSAYYYVYQKPTKKVKVWSHNYRLEITRNDSLMIYKTDIGFRFKRKQDILGSYDLDTSHLGSNSDVIPYSYTAIKELKQNHPQYKSTFSFSGEHKRNQHLSRQKILNYKNIADNVDCDAFDNAHENIVWCKITSIVESSNYVCDFSLDDIDDDNFCHSVVYNGVIGHQTPKGMNHFYSIWDGAIKGPGHKEWNKFIPKEIPWNAVPGRDEEWARTQIRQLGDIRFNQEFKCINYNETITVRNKSTGLIEQLPIGEFYERINMRNM